MPSLAKLWAASMSLDNNETDWCELVAADFETQLPSKDRLH
jgi:hypothetical protein